MKSDKIFYENIFNVYCTCDLLCSLVLPEDVQNSLNDIISVCVPYLSSGFTYTSPCES